MDYPIGTTSACAENTEHLKEDLLGSWNYLRVRGEYHASKISSSSLKELPPRARRILFLDAIDIGLFGTTSACAENTKTRGITPGPAWNYLRVRGEYGELTAGTLTSLELPPRARRIRPWWVSFRRSRGTTSACAENTIYSANYTEVLGNYLRVRGEYSS